MRRCFVGALAMGLGGCVSMDFVLHNNVPCENVGPQTCEGKDGYWDQICTPCETEYAWDRDYDWMPETLAEGESIRAIDPTSVVDVGFPTADGLGELDAYYIPAHGEHPDNTDVLMVYHHGNYAGIEHYLPRIRMAHEAGFAILAWDYRGYGKSLPASVPSPEQWWSDAAEVRDLATTLASDPDKVLIYANSLGGLPAMEMSLYEPGCALVFEAGFTSVEDLTGANSGFHLQDSMLTTGSYDNIEKIKGYGGPFLAMIGDADEAFREEDTERLVENAAAPEADKELWVLPGVHHGITSVGVPDAGYAEWAAHIDAFLDRTGACR